MNVYEGDFISVIGNNGAGKSTLMNAIAGTLSADAGEIDLVKHNVSKKSVAYRSQWMSRVFQDPKMGTAGDLTVMQNLVLAQSHTKTISLKRYQKKAAEEKYLALLRTLNMGLENFLNTQVKYLSGGQRQALSLLMATLSKPKLLLLDEHTAALDPKTSQEVMSITDNIVKEQQLTTMMITHKMSDALKYGNRLIMVQDGQIKLDVSGAQKNNLDKSELLQAFE
ncbi:ABC transporter, ATP-binding protein [Companilactobacillus paralimentarius DSM 13238 = JCM 10415]|uniref:ABC transporter, ATP-binding protein n=1 Tax=Companilactobacillus paralimentarius DSM 13238 = JCM 10415 TaxID=1122151 RepID=A0A0R1PCJ3_9LACO|nr:ABC transporter, ATP-binding protein [Companilactobacillus paralimentarius DSM 13238 = JCM 10415]